MVIRESAAMLPVGDQIRRFIKGVYEKVYLTAMLLLIDLLLGRCERTLKLP